MTMGLEKGGRTLEGMEKVGDGFRTPMFGGMPDGTGAAVGMGCTAVTERGRKGGVGVEGQRRPMAHTGMIDHRRDTQREERQG